MAGRKNSKVKIELNYKGVGQLLKGENMQDALESVTAKIAQNAAINTRNVNPNANVSRAKKMQKSVVGLDESAISKKANVRPGSLAEKANMVQDYNEKHRKK